MRSKADETLVIVETLICPLQIFKMFFILILNMYKLLLKLEILGVLVTDNRKWSSHINQIHSVASHLSYIVLRAFSTKNIWTLLKIYVTYIRPKLEYNSSV